MRATRPRVKPLFCDPPQPAALTCEDGRASADRKCLTGDGVRRRRAQEGDELTDFFCFHKLTDWQPFARLLLNLFERLARSRSDFGQTRARHLGIDPTWADGVAGYSARTHFDRDCTHQAMHARLARAVSSLSHGAKLAKDATYRYEAPGTRHRGDGSVKEVVGTQQVRIEDGSRARKTFRARLIASLAHCQRARDTGIRHRNVEPSPYFRSTRNRGSHMALIAHVADHVPCLPTGMRNLAHYLTKRSFVAPGDENARAARGQLQRDGATDPSASAGNQSHPPRERSPSRHFTAPSTLTAAPVPTM